MEADLARLSREKLQAYTGFLKQQAKELAADVQALQFHPRYEPLIVEGPFGLPAVVNGPLEVERLETVIEQLSAALERLSSDKALEEVRGAVREFRELEHQQTRAPRWR